MANTPEAVRKSIRIYQFIGLVLFLGTVFTVLVAVVPWLDFGQRGFDMVDCIIGLSIATVKASLVAAVFMHLNHERKAVYWIFGSAVLLAASMLALIGLAKSDPNHDPYFNSGRVIESAE
jgi:caa(3)-type oxidase subunit IV